MKKRTDLDAMEQLSRELPDLVEEARALRQASERDAITLRSLTHYAASLEQERDAAVASARQAAASQADVREAAEKLARALDVPAREDVPVTLVLANVLLAAQALLDERLPSLSRLHEAEEPSEPPPPAPERCGARVLAGEGADTGWLCALPKGHEGAHDSDIPF